MTDIIPTPLQSAVLSHRPLFIMSSGGRGSGKSFGMLLAVIDHLREFGPEAKPIVLREDWGGLIELSTELLILCIAAFGSAQRNKSEGTLTVPSGGVIQFSNLADDGAVSRLMGRSFSAMYVDEAGDLSPKAFEFIKAIRGNLRVKPGRIVEIHMTANPGMRSHHSIFSGWIKQAPPFTAFRHGDGSVWVWTTGTFEQNSHLAQDEYRANLMASTHGNAAKRASWLRGEWHSMGGVMWDQFDPAIHIVPEVPGMRMHYRIGCDWGIHALACGVLLGELQHDQTLPNGRVMRYGSVIVLDETHTAIDDEYHLGDGTPVNAFAAQVLHMARQNGVVNPITIVDDMTGIHGVGDSVLQAFRGVLPGAQKPYSKSRTSQWGLIHMLLHNSVTGAGPGLYFYAKCKGLLTVLPAAPRGKKNPEDIEGSWKPAHLIDGFAYGLVHLLGAKVRSGRTTGMF